MTARITQQLKGSRYSSFQYNSTSFWYSFMQTFWQFLRGIL